MVYGSGLENRQGASLRGFESHPLRQLDDLIQSLIRAGPWLAARRFECKFDRRGAERRVKSEALRLEPKRSFG